MKTYLNLLQDVLDNGKLKKNRTGIDTIGVFGRQARFDLSQGFPLLTTKKMFWRGVVHELLWFISGSTNIKYLVDNDVHIWDEWAYKRYCEAVWRQYGKGNPSYQPLTQDNWLKYGDEESFGLGEGTYGGMWRAFPYQKFTNNEVFESFSGTVDQLKNVIEKLKANPNDRRLIVSAWHPYWVDHCALPPCHVLFHFNTEELTLEERYKIYRQNPIKYEINLPSFFMPHFDVRLEESLDKMKVEKRRLNCLLYQRSCDTFLGVPFNIASYALLTEMVAKCCNMVAGEFIHTYGDLHIYTNHVEQCKLQLSREPMTLPTLKLAQKTDLFDFKFEDISLDDYNCYPAIKAEVAV